MELSTITNTIIPGLVVILIWLVVSARNLYQLILMLGINRSNIYTLPVNGRASIIGKAAGNTIESPINNTPCLYWQIEVKELVARDEDRGRGLIKRTYWTTTFIGSSGYDFYISDGTGRLYLRPPLADITISDHILYENPEDRIYGILKDLGVKTSNSMGLEKSLQVVERFITTGKELFVRGTVKEDRGIKILAGNLFNPMMITDRRQKDISGLYRRLLIKAGIVLLSAPIIALLTWSLMPLE